MSFAQRDVKLLAIHGETRLLVIWHTAVKTGEARVDSIICDRFFVHRDMVCVIPVNIEEG